MLQHSVTMHKNGALWDNLKRTFAKPKTPAE
jgi:hypothetical protein